MYTNIDTDHALEVIACFLQTSPLCTSMPHAAIIAGLEILMRNNIFCFGDTFWHQQQGTTMGTPLAPPHTTLYFGIQELKVVPRFTPFLRSYSGYINDVLGVWLHNTDPAVDWQNYLTFETSMNSFRKL
jgi:hypothetical protein